MHPVFKLLTIALVFISCSKDHSVSSASDILTRVYSSSKDTHPTSFSYNARSIVYHNGKVFGEQQQYYAQQYPHGLIVKFDSLNSPNGIIFKYDSSYTYQNNSLEFVNFRPHRIWKQAFSIKFEEPKLSLDKLYELGIDTTIISDTKFNNRKVYIIGAEPGELKSNQFWIDKEKLVTLRIITYLRERDFLWDVRFEDYFRLNDSWFVGTIRFFENNTLTLVEEHKNLQITPAFPDSFFAPVNFQSLRW